MDDLQLLIADRLETQADQMLMTNATDAHHTDVSLDRAGQIRRIDGADADFATRPGTKHGNIKHDADARNGNISRGKLKVLPANLQLHPAFQIEAK